MISFSLSYLVNSAASKYNSDIVFHEVEDPKYFISTHPNGFKVYEKEPMPNGGPRLIINIDYLIDGAYLCQPYKLTDLFLYVSK